MKFTVEAVQPAGCNQCFFVFHRFSVTERRWSVAGFAGTRSVTCKPWQPFERLVRRPYATLFRYYLFLLSFLLYGADNRRANRQSSAAPFGWNSFLLFVSAEHLIYQLGFFRCSVRYYSFGKIMQRKKCLRISSKMNFWYLVFCGIRPLEPSWYIIGNLSSVKKTLLMSIDWNLACAS
jgi:hypothetical protein